MTQDDGQLNGAVATTSRTHPAWIRSTAPLLFLDFETGGLDPLSDEIVEVGAVLASHDGQRVVASYTSKVRPLHPELISKDARRVNGFSPEEWHDAVPLEAALQQILLLASGAILVGHSTRFDWGFLVTALHSRGLVWPGMLSYHDTLDIAAFPVVAGLPDHRLTTIARYAGCSTEHAHSAGVDAEMCRQVYVWATAAGESLPVHRLSSIVVKSSHNGTQSRRPIPILSIPGRSRAQGLRRSRWVVAVVVVLAVVVWLVRMVVTVTILAVALLVALVAGSATRQSRRGRPSRQRRRR